MSHPKLVGATAAYELIIRAANENIIAAAAVQDVSTSASQGIQDVIAAIAQQAIALPGKQLVVATAAFEKISPFPFNPVITRATNGLIFFPCTDSVVSPQALKNIFFSSTGVFDDVVACSWG
ncbi:MAG: hypothetical protein VKK04_25005 [Synechococcales bacterium]|nr:hypothetical protein [Synechococcales bacterium]